MIDQHPFDKKISKMTKDQKESNMLKSCSIILLSLLVSFSLFAEKDAESSKLEKKFSRSFINLKKSKSMKLKKFYYGQLSEAVKEIRNSEKIIFPRIDLLLQEI